MNEVPPGRKPLPIEHLPAPTLWPSAFALGITLAFWGLLSSGVILATGGAVLAAALLGWINEIRHEQRHRK